MSNGDKRLASRCNDTFLTIRWRQMHKSRFGLRHFFSSLRKFFTWTYHSLHLFARFVIFAVLKTCIVKSHLNFITVSLVALTTSWFTGTTRPSTLSSVWTHLRVSSAFWIWSRSAIALLNCSLFNVRPERWIHVTFSSHALRMVQTWKEDTLQLSPVIRHKVLYIVRYCNSSWEMEINCDIFLPHWLLLMRMIQKFLLLFISVKFV